MTGEETVNKVCIPGSKNLSESKFLLFENCMRKNKNNCGIISHIKEAINVNLIKSDLAKIMADEYLTKVFNWKSIQPYCSNMQYHGIDSLFIDDAGKLVVMECKLGNSKQTCIEQSYYRISSTWTKKENLIQNSSTFNTNYHISKIINKYINQPENIRHMITRLIFNGNNSIIISVKEADCKNKWNSVYNYKGSISELPLDLKDILYSSFQQDFLSKFGIDPGINFTIQFLNKTKCDSTKLLYEAFKAYGNRSSYWAAAPKHLSLSPEDSFAYKAVKDLVCNIFQEKLGTKDMPKILTESLFQKYCNSLLMKIANYQSSILVKDLGLHESSHTFCSPIAGDLYNASLKEFVISNKNVIGPFAKTETCNIVSKFRFPSSISQSSYTTNVLSEVSKWTQTVSDVYFTFTSQYYSLTGKTNFWGSNTMGFIGRAHAVAMGSVATLAYMNSLYISNLVNASVWSKLWYTVAPLPKTCLSGPLLAASKFLSAVNPYVTAAFVVKIGYDFYSGCSDSNTIRNYRKQKILDLYQKYKDH